MAQRSTYTQVGYLAHREPGPASVSDGEGGSLHQRRLAMRTSTKVLRGERRVTARSDPTSLARPRAIALSLTRLSHGRVRVTADSRLASV